MRRFRAYDKRIILVQTIDLHRDKIDNGINNHRVCPSGGKSSHRVCPSGGKSSHGVCPRGWEKEARYGHVKENCIISNV